jgi:putative copper export protein
MPGTRYARLIMIAVAVVVIVGMIVSMVAIPFTS